MITILIIFVLCLIFFKIYFWYKKNNFNTQYLFLLCSNIKWKLISDYNSEGLKYVNLNGIAGEFENKSEYSGLNESKLGFNATITEYIGEFDIVLNSFAFNLYKKMNTGN